MAKSQAEIEGLKQAYRQYLGRDAEQSAIDAFAGSNVSLNDRVNELIASPESQAKQTGIAQSQVNPEVAAATQDAQRKLELTQNQASDQKSAAQLEADQNSTTAKTNNQRLQDELAKTYARIRQQNPYNTIGVTSGAREGFVNDQQTTAVTNATQDLNQSLAFIAQRLSAANTSISNGLALAQKHTGEDIINAQSAGRSKVSSLTQQLVSNLQTQRQKDQATQRTNAISDYKLGATIPQGQGVQLPDGTVIQGNQAAKTQLTTINGQRVMIDSATGKVLNVLGSSTTPKAAKASSGKVESNVAANGVTKSPGYKIKKSSYGGLSFQDKAGKAITAAQYLSGFQDQVSVSDIRSLLAQSGDPGDEQIINEIDSGTPIQTLQKKYPYVFGG